MQSMWPHPCFNRLPVVVLSLTMAQLKLGAEISVRLYPRDNLWGKKNGLCLRHSESSLRLHFSVLSISSSIKNVLRLRPGLDSGQHSGNKCFLYVKCYVIFSMGLVLIHMCAGNCYSVHTGCVGLDSLVCAQNPHNTLKCHGVIWKNISNSNRERLRLRLAKPTSLALHAILHRLKRAVKLSSSAVASPNQA